MSDGIEFSTKIKPADNLSFNFNYTYTDTENRYAGFNVFCGNRILPTDDTAMENLARYINRALFSKEHMR